MTNIFTIKNLQLAIMAGIFAFVTVYFVAPELMQGANVTVAEACCGTDPGTDPDPGDTSDHDLPPRCISFNALPSTVKAGGGSTTLTWVTSSFGAPNSKVSINNGVGVVGVSGSKTVSVTKTTTYVLTTANSAGSDSCSVTVTVPDAPAPTCDSFTALPKSVIAGQSTVLSWATTNASSVTIDRGVGSVSVDGSKSVKVSDTPGSYTYTLTATGNGKSVSCPVTVDVTPAPVPKTCEVTANLSSVNFGGSVTLTWKTSGYTNVTLNGESVAANGSKTYTNIQVDTTYTLIAKSADGKDNCTAKVVVKCIPPAVPVCDSFKADPATIKRGESSTLTWATTNATSVTINQGVGAVAVDGSKSVTPNQTTTYTLTATGNGKTVTCPVTVTVTVPAPVPVCTLSANPTTITSGNSSTLTWTSQNATTRVIDQGIGSVAANGDRSVTPGVTTTYTMTVTNSEGVERTCAVTIKVNPAPQAPVCDSFTAAPATIKRGESSTLTWATTRANNVTINHGIGSVAVDGTTTVSPLDTTTYTLTATGAGGSVTCPVTVTVKEPVDHVPVCNSFTATPSTLPHRGGDVTLRWETTRATEVKINQGIGSVAVDGSRELYVNQTKNFVLTATDDDGDQVTCSVRVLVEDEEEDPITCEDNVSFSANPRSIDEGDDSWLTWSTTGITSVRFEGINSTSLSGSERVSPRSDTTYVLIASDGDDTIRCPIDIDVDEDNGGGGGSATPRCELSISDKSISSGERVTLKWKTSNATRVYLKDNHGKTLMTTDGVLSRDKDELYDGEITVRPEKDTTYTLTAERGSRDRDCTVKVDVDDKLVVIETRDQLPLVTGISLTQVPYTGFEAGPMLTVIFYALLVLWAVYLAYVLVIRKNVDLVEAYANAGTIMAREEDIIATPQDIKPELFVEAKETPAFTVASVTAAPVKESVQVGYGSTVVSNDEATMLENQAHASQVLLSSDAMRYFMTTTEGIDRSEVLDSIIEHAKASYPAEDGWVVLNEERLVKACAVCVAAKAAPSNEAPFIPAAMPVGNSSLAEAIVTGNIVAAYQMIGNRPMIALTDAAADLDALYRFKQGASVQVSEMLMTVGGAVEADKLHAAITALTSALDGTYTNEAEAVKMAIMKATKAVNS